MSAQNTIKSSQKRLKIIVTGAHPDDPETGAGGTMALAAQAGHAVMAAYLRRGEAGIPVTTAQNAAEIRTREAQAACELLGTQAEFLGQIEGAAAANENT